MCGGPKTLLNMLICTTRGRQSSQHLPRLQEQDQDQAQRSQDQDQDQRSHDQDQDQAQRSEDQDQGARGEKRKPAAIRRSLFPSFAEIVFKMQQTMSTTLRGNEQKGSLLGGRTSGKDLEETIRALKVSEERRSKNVGQGRGGGGGGGGHGQGIGGGGGGLGHGQGRGQLSKQLLWRGHQCYYNPASCY